MTIRSTTSTGKSAFTKGFAISALIVAGVMAATPALADRRHTTTTVIRETVYHSPSRVIVEPAVVIPISNSVYLGLGSNTYVSSGHRHTTVHREVHRDVHREVHRHGNYYDRGFRPPAHGHSVWGHPGRGNAHGHHKEPARGRWSGSDRHHDVIYVDRNGRINSSYREAERRSVVIRERSR